MKCAFHFQNNAVVSCNSCGRPLCTACDHRIKGFPFCEECIVAGVGMLQSTQTTSGRNEIPGKTSPFIATALSFILPGLGAAYNGQTIKALTFFAVFAGCFQMSVLTNAPLFVFGILGIWAFSMIDAWRTAKAIRAGTFTSNPDDYISQRFSGNTMTWGIVLSLLGIAIFVQAAFDLKFVLRGVLPVGLIIFGAYLLRDFVFSSRNSADANVRGALNPARANAESFTERSRSDNWRS